MKRTRRPEGHGFTDPWIRCVESLPPWDKFKIEKLRDLIASSSAILDVSASLRNFKAFLPDMTGRAVTTVDIDPEINPDVIADICDLHMFESSTFDGIICLAVLEHVYDPIRACEELSRVAKDGAKCFAYVPWMWPYHQSPKDFYRFSSDAVRYLFRSWSVVELCPVRGRVETILNLIPGFGKRSNFHRHFGRLIRRYDRLDERYASGFRIFAVK